MSGMAQGLDLLPAGHAERAPPCGWNTSTGGACEHPLHLSLFAAGAAGLPVTKWGAGARRLHTQLENAGTVQLERNWGFASPMPGAVGRLELAAGSGNSTSKAAFCAAPVRMTACVYLDQTMVIGVW